MEGKEAVVGGHVTWQQAIRLYRSGLFRKEIITVQKGRNHANPDVSRSIPSQLNQK